MKEKGRRKERERERDRDRQTDRERERQRQIERQRLIFIMRDTKLVYGSNNSGPLFFYRTAITRF